MESITLHNWYEFISILLSYAFNCVAVVVVFGPLFLWSTPGFYSQIQLYRCSCCVWSTCFISIFFTGVEIAERLAYAGILANLVIYLTDVTHDSTAATATNVNVWNGVASMLPFVGAFVADSYLGRYWTITLSSVIYLMVSICLFLFKLFL